MEFELGVVCVSWILLMLYLSTHPNQTIKMIGIRLVIYTTVLGLLIIAALVGWVYFYTPDLPYVPQAALTSRLFLYKK